MKLSFIHFRLRGFRNRAFLLFFLYPWAATWSAQSARPSHADAASRAVYQEGLAALQKGDLTAARADFEKVLRIAPRSPEGHNSLGWVLLAEGKIDLAIAQFRTALRLHPEFALAHMNLSSLPKPRRLPK